MAQTNCSNCKKVIDTLEVFPKGYCVECYEKLEFVMPTAQELVRMWGGK